VPIANSLDNMVAITRSQVKFPYLENSKNYKTNKWHMKRNGEKVTMSTSTIATILVTADLGSTNSRLLKGNSSSLKQKELSSTDVTKDTLILLCSITIISITLYLTFQFWKKHKDRPM